MSTKVYELLFMIKAFLIKNSPAGKKFPVGITVGVIDSYDKPTASPSRRNSS